MEVLNFFLKQPTLADSRGISDHHLWPPRILRILVLLASAELPTMEQLAPAASNSKTQALYNNGILLHSGLNPA